MKHHIVWSDKAVRALELIHAFIALDSEIAAKKVIAGIVASVDHLISFPLAGSIEPRLEKLYYEYRYVVYRHYKVIYRLESDATIIIVLVFDTRQNPTKLKLG